MINRIKLFWTTKDRDAYGNALGYSVHDKQMRKYSEPYFDFTPDADIALHIVSADIFVPILNKFNILFTMWEFLDCPPSYISAFNKADAIIVPCQFCKDLFRKYTDTPIYICREGIEPELFPYYERNPRPSKFRFLWVGAPNMRKGYPFVLQAINVLGNNPNVEFYIKTTIPKVDPDKLMEDAKKMYEKAMDDEKVKAAQKATAERISKGMKMDTITVLGDHKNIIFDTRKIDLTQLRDLYNSAQCVLLPSMGEGWGLTLCEGMATGAPCIATDITGQKDYFDEDVGFPIRTTIEEIDLTINYKIKAHSYMPVFQDMIGRMLQVMQYYPLALHKGKKASERIHRKYTWARSASRLYDIINEIKEEFLIKGESNARIPSTISRG